jgi:hypothetical protein
MRGRYILFPRPRNRPIIFTPRRTSLPKGPKKKNNFKATDRENSFRDKPKGKTSKFLLFCLRLSRRDHHNADDQFRGQR